jgi:hypothetical protein
MILVTNEVLEGLTEARDSGEHNMFDYYSVMDWCINNGYRAAALWMYENKAKYMNGVMQGFTSDVNIL